MSEYYLDTTVKEDLSVAVAMVKSLEGTLRRLYGIRLSVIEGDYIVVMHTASGEYEEIK